MSQAPATSDAQFMALIESHRGIVWKLIRLHTRHAEDQKDLYQEVIYQAWRSFQNYQGKAKFSTWLYRVCLNTLLTHQRKRPIVFATDDLELLDRGKDEMPARLDSEHLYEAIRTLPEVDRGLIALHLEGFDNEEIGEVAGITANNVAVKLHRIRERLSRILTPKPKT